MPIFGHRPRITGRGPYETAVGTLLRDVRAPPGRPPDGEHRREERPREADGVEEDRRSHGTAFSGVAIASSMSSTGPGAPPCRGPLSAPIAATTAETLSEPVDATTRAAKVDAFIP
jgi:hypothetical protein